MGKEAEFDRHNLPANVKEKLHELVAALAECKYGPDGRPPLETTFATIEAYGHQAGRMVAQAVDKHLTQQHTDHFSSDNNSPCPNCGRDGGRQHARSHPIETRDGEIAWDEPAHRCDACQRAFFPTANPVAD